jgi:hypothetical protein
MASSTATAPELTHEQVHKILVKPLARSRAFGERRRFIRLAHVGSAMRRVEPGQPPRGGGPPSLVQTAG